ncbi:protein-L-isoaspartate O-methyltransferase [Thiomicrorhabdus immobilis]|uniref:Protein-L-isoaspartate O-methyltransferase n=1 Tax=Thiomicrorhabdus immobilis TaxID=2791037 RepID=A0ABN6CWC7_9GAMM|nr:protein-L-isoaspartate(D-aspartate) O-methyltransferase [Thiomicrorhabdus immobilis]BCN93412.1 protein-L-isoaspartate O-methyltransferase [Thiomicrorhabdus immobilis]
MQYPNAAFEKHQGLGMTSQRTRNRLVDRLVEKGVSSSNVLEVMRIVPRHLFLDEAMASRSYEDTALPIGYGQTISQPWVVAKMTQWLLDTSQPINRVLEIGTGSGYQTAILSLLVDEVFSVERIQPLSERAMGVLQTLELDNIQFSLSDGHWGWPDKAPFDAIISAASPAELPQELINQLKMGGRLVMPIGETKQLLYGFEKTPNGIIETCLGEVMFVPMKEGIEA